MQELQRHCCMNTTLVWLYTTSWSMSIRYDWSRGIFNKARSTNGNARKRKWWMRVKFCDWYKSCNDIFIILYLYMNTTLEWLYTTSSCMSIRYGWSRGIFNKARSTNGNARKRKWWMRVKFCDWCKSYNGIFIFIFFIWIRR